METKFTKGQWSRNPKMRGTEHWIMADGQPVGAADRRNKDWVANADLMAAASELYEACQMQQRLIDDMARFVGKMALQDYALFNEAPIKARAALAKAIGERS